VFAAGSLDFANHLLQLIERGVPSHEVFGHLGNEDAVRGSVELF